MDSGNRLVYGDEAATPAPAGVQTFRCDACFKTFSTAGNLSRHLESSRVCRAWLETSKSRLMIDASEAADDESHQARDAFAAMKGKRPFPPVLTGSFIHDRLTVSGSTCHACGKDFATPGSLSRHYRTNVVCDRTRARDLLDTLKDSFRDMFRVGLQHAELQETGFEEVRELGPVDATNARILPAPDTHMLPPPTLVGTPKTRSD